MQCILGKLLLCPLFIEEVAEACTIDPMYLTPVDQDRKLDPSDFAKILSGLAVIEPALLKNAEEVRQ